jgi:hypothetical protein
MMQSGCIWHDNEWLMHVVGNNLRHLTGSMVMRMMLLQLLCYNLVTNSYVDYLATYMQGILNGSMIKTKGNYGKVL